MMPREVRVLAVEDKPWWMQPLFSFPFVGDLSARQVLLVIVFIVIAIYASITLKLGFLEGLVLVLTGLFIGLGVAKKPVKAVLPEKQLLIVLTGRHKPRTKPVKMARPINKAKHVGIPETLEVYARDPTRIPTVKIVGVLRDPLGNPLVDEELEVYVNGRLYTRAKTGSSGEYTVYYSPEGPGLYEVEIRLHGKTVLKRRIRMGVRG